MRASRFKIWAGILLAIAIATVAMWVRSYRHVDRWGFSTLHSRYTFKSQNGKISIAAPASPPSVASEAQAWQDLKRLRNEDIEWSAGWTLSRDRETPVLTALIASPIPNSPASRLQQNPASFGRPLLRALDGPKKFAAAHVLLMEHFRKSRSCVVLIRDGRASGDFNGLHLAIPETSAKNAPLGPFDHAVLTPLPDSPVTIDADRRASLRDYWHDRLDVTVASFSYGWLLLLAAIPPILCMPRFLRERSRRLKGHCICCGYNVRAGNSKCPECGHVRN